MPPLPTLTSRMRRGITAVAMIVSCAPGPTFAATPAPDQHFEARLFRAQALAKEDRHAEALQELAAAAEKEPQRYEPAAMAALVMAQSGRFDQAEEMLGVARGLARSAQLARVQRISQIVAQAREAAAEPVEPAGERQLTWQGRAMDALRAADQAGTAAARRIHLWQFLEVASAYVHSWPDDRRMWLLYATAALELDQRDAGLVAGRAIDRLGEQGASVEERSLINRTRLRLMDRDWMGSDAMTTGELMNSLPARLPDIAWASSKWSNSLGMGFVTVGGLYWSIYETTIEQYHAFVRATNRSWAWEQWQTVKHPAINVSWQDAEAFCRWLTERDRVLGYLKPSQSYRLPTDVEWSAAAGLAPEPGSTPADKHGMIKRFDWGTAESPPNKAGNYADESLAEVEPTLKRIAGYYDGYERTAPVGKFASGPNGLHDLGGNVSEWTGDWWDGLQQQKVARGGSWKSEHAVTTGYAWRTPWDPNRRSNFIGFRVVLVP